MKGTQRGGIAIGRLVIGLVLVAVGGLWLLGNLGVVPPFDLGRYWYLIPLVIGAAKLALGPDGETRRSGVWFLLAGLYGWVSVERIGGLSYRTAWPVFVIAGGLLLAFDALGGRRSSAARAKEVDDVR